jgi:hypothetical protein
MVSPRNVEKQASARILTQQAPNHVQFSWSMRVENRVALILLTLLLMIPLRGWTEEPVDPSNALHVLAGASGALLVGALAYPLVDLGSDRCDAALVAGLGVSGAFVLGLTKELLDLRGWGQPELSDLLLTLGGGLLAGTLVYALTCLQPAAEEGSLGITAVYAAFALVLSLPVGESLYRRTSLSLRPRS